MEQYLYEWLNLLVRWTHVIAGIMWIGDSLLFMWLDKSLTPAAKSEEGLMGDLWMVHGGGFYHLQKRWLKPGQLPAKLHWFKWEATGTWLTGFALLWIVYYLGGVLIDPSSEMSNTAATMLCLGVLAGSWIVYDQLWKLPLSSNVVSAILLLCLAGVIFGLSKVLTGRALYIHTGALLGTCMVLNVWVRILPAQRELIRSTQDGKPQDPSLGARAKLRSRHNNYMTYPVIFTMISNHFPTTYGHELNWLVLLLFISFGASVRHAINAGKGTPYLVYGIAAISLFALFYLTFPAL